MDDLNSKNPYKNFNKATKMFIKDLMRSYPTIPEFKMILAGYKMIKSINKKLVHQMFVTTVEPYTENIKKRDDSFFTAEFKLPEDYSIVYKAMLPVFVNLWQVCDEVNREAVWTHLEYLLKKSEKCKTAK
jgi:hypothetical protein